MRSPVVLCRRGIEWGKSGEQVWKLRHTFKVEEGRRERKKEKKCGER